MDLVGKTVRHRFFGRGTVTRQGEQSISVLFEKQGEKNFEYPGCFQSFLAAEDEEINAKLSEIAQRHEKAREEQKQHRTREIQRNLLSVQSDKSIQIDPFHSVWDFCDCYIQALSSEIAFVRQNGGKHFLLSEGKLIKKEGTWSIYSFETEDELNCPDETQITIWYGQSKIFGKILSSEGFQVFLASEIDLGKEVESLEISTESWRLLQSLSDRLQELKTTQSELVESLVSRGYDFIQYGDQKIKTGQQTAVDMSCSQKITFVWGPPGTGKTQTLARIALEHMKRGHRVLMLSYSNVSVDGAILRIADMDKNLKPGDIVRYGYPKSPEILIHDFLSSYQLALYIHPELQKERKELLEKRQKMDKNSPLRLQVDRRLGEIRNKLKTEEKRLLHACKFVATTISKTVVDAAIRNSQFDVVIFDEASMALIPQIVYAANLAQKHFVCMGDFRQLPPIVQSGQKSILNADIFQYCGITRAVDAHCSHQWLCMLDKQYRMHPVIAEYAGQTMYGGLLKSAQNVKEKRQNITDQPPFPGKPIQIVDLSDMMSVCIKTSDGSRVNVLSALLTFSLALEAARKQEVGIITPYRGQARLLHAMAYDVNAMNLDIQPIACATVHQFQGSEKDLILYDAVDCYRMPYPGVLLTSTVNRYADRLFNVAVTRAKGKFIALANVAFMQNKNLSEHLMFSGLIKRWKKEAPAPAELIDERIKNTFQCLKFYQEVDAAQDLLRDIQGARKEVRVDVPNSVVESCDLNRIAKAMTQALNRGVKVVVRAESVHKLAPCLKPFARENSSAVNPVIVIDKKVVWFGMPESNANFISEGRIIPVHCRPHIRFEGRHTALCLYGLLGMKNDLDQRKVLEKPQGENNAAMNFSQYVVAHKTCSKCGQPMQLRKNKKGRFFLGCTGYPRCKETEWVEPDFVEDYLYQDKMNHGLRCPRCNTSMEAKAGQYGVYVQCCGSVKHRFSLNEI